MRIFSARKGQMRARTNSRTGLRQSAAPAALGMVPRITISGASA